MSATGTDELLRLTGASKTFGDVTVLHDAELALEAGSVHGLLGQNGSGKSTLIKILSGYHAPDDGALVVRGEPVRLPLRGGQGAELGIAFVHQDLGLVERGSVVDNVCMPRWQRRRTLAAIPWAAERRWAREALHEFGVDVDVAQPVHSLPQGARALIAIVRALAVAQVTHDPIVVLDEPTASLPRHEVELLFDGVRRIAQRGGAVLFVSHRLDEVRTICDEVPVLRDGRMAGTGDPRAMSEAELIRLIIGKDLAQEQPSAPRPAPAERALVLEVDELAGEVLDGVAFGLREGEVLGMTGLEGMGHEEVPGLLFGLAPLRAGRITLFGEPLRRPLPHVCIRRNMVMLPADRQRHGGIGRATVADNVTMPYLGEYFARGWLRKGRERAEARAIVERFDVRPPDPEASFGSLSGGNQQKVLLGKWLRRGRVLILHEPAHGVDVEARQQILATVGRIAEAGGSVILVSNEYDALAALCDRVLVFRDGRRVGELARGDLSEDGLLAACLTSAETR